MGRASRTSTAPAPRTDDTNAAAPGGTAGDGVAVTDRRVLYVGENPDVCGRLTGDDPGVEGVTVTLAPDVGAAVVHFAESPVDCVVVEATAAVVPFLAYVDASEPTVPVVLRERDGSDGGVPADLVDVTCEDAALEDAVARLFDRPADPGATGGAPTAGRHRPPKAPVGTFRLDGDGIVTSLNAVAAKDLGSTRERLLGRPLVDAVGGSDATELLEAARSAIETGELRERRTDRGGRPSHSSFVPLPDGEVQVVTWSVGGNGTRSLSEEEPAFVETVVNSLTDIFFVLDLNWNFVHWNDRLNAVTGYDDAEIETMSPFQFFPEDQVDYAAEALDQIMNAGYASREIELLTRYGERVPFEFTGSLVYDDEGEPQYFCGVARDITERREAQSALRESEQQFRSVIEGVTDYAIFRLDAGGTIESWNSGAEAIKGYTEEEIVGEHFSVFYPEETREAGVPDQMLAGAAEDGRAEDEGWRVRKDGSRFWAHAVLTALRDDDGDLEGFVKVTRDMTERRESEQRLRHEKELTDRILETSPVGISVVEEDGTVVRANAHAQEHLAVDGSGEFEYMAGERAVYDAEGDPVPPVERPYMEIFETGESVYDWLCQVDLAENGRRWLSISGAPIFDDDGEVGQVVTVAEDVTELKSREEELIRERNQTEELLKTAPVAISVTDADGNTLLANQRAQDALGLGDGGFVDGPAGPGEWTVLDADGEAVESAEAMVERVIETGEPVFDRELVVERPDGERVWFSVNVVPVFGPDGEVTKVISAGEDITALKVRERELERQRTELDEVVRELRRSNAELEQFAYVASHDLKEPLRMVSSYLQLIERRYGDDLDGDAEEFFEYAIDGAERMRAMISALLEYSRLGRQGDPPEPVDCNEVVDSVLANLEVAIEETEAEVTVEDLPTVEGDPDQLRQLFQNLVGNAIEYAGEAAPTVHVGVERRGAEWLFSVEDDGVGIPAERTERIFDLFMSDEETGGTGIGLAICEKIVDRHGGRIWVESEPGVGSTFQFTVPDSSREDVAAAAGQRASSG